MTQSYAIRNLLVFYFVMYLSYSASTTKVTDRVFILISLVLIMVQTQYNVERFNGTSQDPARCGGLGLENYNS
jgi:hypothetical protein